MARKKPTLSLRRPADPVDPHLMERFVRGPASAPVAAPASEVEAVHAHAPAAETPKRSDVQTPKRSDARKAAAASKSLVYRKRTDDVRRRMTVYLPEDLSRRLRLYAAEKDQDYSIVLAEALSALLDRKHVP